MAEYAILDPELLSSCPKSLIAANGMDALTQLIESYVSIKANPITDALSLSGVESVKRGLISWYNSPGDVDAQSCMAYAALMSGVTLAQVGLGSVHGLASPLGAFFPIPHGVVCGTLLAEATRANIKAMQQREPNNKALKRYATLGKILCSEDVGDDESARNGLINTLQQWTDQMNLPLLADFGIIYNDLDQIVKHSRGNSMKTNPIVMTDDELKQLLLTRLTNNAA